jgi:hypothetical protein
MKERGRHDLPGRLVVVQQPDGFPAHADGMAPIRPGHPRPQRLFPFEQPALCPRLVMGRRACRRQGAEETPGQVVPRAEPVRRHRPKLAPRPRAPSPEPPSRDAAEPPGRRAATPPSRDAAGPPSRDAAELPGAALTMTEGCDEAEGLGSRTSQGGQVSVPRTTKSRGRHRASLVAAVVLASAVATVAGSGEPAAVATPAGSAGSFTFTGEVSGSLKVVAFLPPGHIITGCEISPTQAGTDIIQWDNAKLKIGGKTESIANLVIQVDVEKFGRSYSMSGGSSGTPPGAITLETNARYSWISDSGSVKTSSSGASGSVTGTLTAGKNQAGTATVKGSWAGCAKLGA